MKFKKFLDPHFLYQSLVVQRAKLFKQMKEISANCLFLGVEEPLEISRPFLFKNGRERRELKKSPHYFFLKELVKGRELDKTAYFQWKKSAHGCQRAREIMEAFIGQFRMMKELDEKGGLKSWLEPVIVFEDVLNWRGPQLTRGRPLRKREGYQPRNYEIYDGHHRAAILAFLGKKKIPCLMISPLV